jgi:hypothetical protein
MRKKARGSQMKTCCLFFSRKQAVPEETNYRLLLAKAIDGEFGNNAKVRIADKSEIAEHKPRLQVLILELVPNSESIDLLS